MFKVEAKFNKEIEEVLRRLYIDEHLSIPEMMSEVGISDKTLINWLKQSGIYSRKLKL